MVGTFWAFVPAILAIVLALITKKVYLSLFAGIFLGAMFLAKGNPLNALGQLFSIMGTKVGANIGILVFLVMLGVLVVLMMKSGGSRAYGNWASTKIKSRTGAMLATAGLGVMIFVDDYFNCLTVGNVMRPVTDKYRVSRAKLSYIIDSTAAPVCIIAPISSWAAAVSGTFADNGLAVFIQTIPFNLYALLTLAMVFILCAKRFDFFRMNKHESVAVNKGDLTGGFSDLPDEDLAQPDASVKGKVRYMIIPLVTLISCCIGCMLYTGYFFDGSSFVSTPLSSNIIEAFSNCNAGLSLAIGSTITVVATFIYYLACKVVSFDAVNDTIVDGFKSMVSAILILTLAWTLSGIMGADGGGLEASTFIRKVVDPSKIITALIPAVLFIIAVGISFSTGTSWGTFGILIPIATAIIGTKVDVNVILTISAVLAGAVVGDHVSPISDTTILSSSGAQCNHVEHVSTQMPYAMLVAGICLISYIASGFIAQTGLGYWPMALITLSIGFALLLATLIPVYYHQKKKGLLHKEITRADIEEQAQ